jgi:hypothetical protein
MALSPEEKLVVMSRASRAVAAMIRLGTLAPSDTRAAQDGLAVRAAAVVAAQACRRRARGRSPKVQVARGKAVPSW